MIIQEIYYILISKLCLTGFVLKASGIRNIQDRSTHMLYVSTQLEEVSKIGRHTCSMHRHNQQKYFKDVDSLEGCVDTVFNIQLTR